jgi:diguanylate cyclase (GGDEF)-like protein
MGVTVGVMCLQFTGVFQLLEWAMLNQWFRLRPPEDRTVPIVLVTIDEADIQWLGRWPMTDTQLAALLNRLKAARPTAIGLDLYRDLPIEPGHAELLQVFRTTPNLFGIQKAIGNPTGTAVPPPPVLGERGQIGINDLLLDADGTVRRNLLSIGSEQQEVMALGTRLALIYLETQKIKPRRSSNPNQVHLGQAHFERLHPNTGGYVWLDTGGFQTLANFLRIPGGLSATSLKAVMLGQVPPTLFQDKLVFIGVKAESTWGDRFYTPFTTDSKTTWAGVEIHANVAAQIITSAMAGRPLLRGLPEAVEWAWILLWAGVGTILGWALRSLVWAIVLVAAVVGLLLGAAYGAFLGGWWVVVISPLLAFKTAGLISRSYWIVEVLKQANLQLEQKVQERTQELRAKNRALEQARLQAETANQALERLARIDDLTQVANRRFFNEVLQQEWQRMQRLQLPLSLILLDVDCFKLYNDTYGHPAGDACLSRIADALQASVQRSTDFVARYGGEEFAILLPNTPLPGAMQVATNIRSTVKQLAIPHTRSSVSSLVTLSIGVACIDLRLLSSPTQLVQRADEALYQAKASGRDRIVVLESVPDVTREIS